MLIRYKSIKFIPLRTLSLCLDLWVLCQCILVYCILCFNNSENISLITYVMGLWSGVSIDMIFEPWPETNPNDGIWARMLEMAMVVAHHLTVLVAVNIAQGCHTHFERCELKSGDSRLSHENACFKLTFDLFFLPLLCVQNIYGYVSLWEVNSANPNHNENKISKISCNWKQIQKWKLSISSCLYGRQADGANSRTISCFETLNSFFF